MLYDVGLLALGFLLVAKGGDLFVDSSVQIARVIRVPRIVIGGTLVSLATTTPELVVSVTASVLGDSGIALGNAVGSCIANIGLIAGTVAVVSRVTVDLDDFTRRARWMLLTAALVVLFSWNLSIGRLPVVILLVFTAAYLYGDYRSIRARQARNPGPEDENPAASLVTPGLWFLAGFGLIFAGSRFLVASGISLATSLGIPSVIIGLSVVAVGTSLPELVTGVASARKGVPDLSIGNILGANVLNLGLIIGVSGAIHPLTLTRFTLWYSYPWMIAFMIAMRWMGRTGTLDKRGGSVLLLLYGIYLVGLILYPALSTT